ncbi:YigZ family protein [Variovorax sp. J22P168]|uniref:IMPACT family protein n=1 Tax=Variovorax jilinensis TaxID=3053513 RepID=UPI002577FB06|nr:YigZ family protein [Variovorax sp. J22P168]MDM0014213.1 YigZ family protein [Variovorax sp. J22P168]
MPFTLSAPRHSELVIRKSRFIGCVRAVEDRAAAQAEVDALRRAHPGAAHVCWALMAGGQSAANDDGEPGGTAGRPMLEVLRHHELEGVLATVVRYFGGVKLGAGGLARAYTDSIASALADAERVPLLRQRRLHAAVPYALEGLLRRELAAAGATIAQVRHDSLVHFEFSLPEPAAAAFIAALDDAAQGRVAWLPA